MKQLFSLAVLFLPLAFTPGSAHAAVQTRIVEYKAGDSTFVGFLAWDDAVATEKSPAPGVVVCPEWWGNNQYAQERARQLAELGYVALSIDMYGKGDDGKAKTTADPKQAGEWAGAVFNDPKAMEARVVAGMKALTDQKIVDTKKVAAIGYCMGGTVALTLARSGAELRAVVAFHASNLAAKDEADNSKIKATLLICHGQDDAFVQPGELDKFHAQMKAAKVDYALYTYSGAIHAFTNPKADEYNVPGVAYNKNADVRSWAAMRALCEEKFGRSDRGRSALDARPLERDIARVESENKDAGLQDAEFVRRAAASDKGDNALPEPLTFAQIEKMKLSECIREMSRRRHYPESHPSLDAATKERLANEDSMLEARIKKDFSKR